MQNQSAHDAFVSFSFSDQELAENIVNLLTSQYGISCWICSRDIVGGKRYKKLIPEAIDQSRVLVLLQSASAIESKEIPKEVGMAFDADIPIIPFKIDDANLKGDLRYDLYGIEFIDARIPTFEERVSELAKAIKSFTRNEQQIATVEETGRLKLLSTPNVLPKMVFCGRDGLLRDIHSQFQAGERVLFLYGMGGIGKTQIAKQYAKQYKEHYDTIIYATYHNGIRELLLAETPFVIEPALVRYTLSNGDLEDDDAFLARKANLLAELSNERTLVILDNFDVDEDEDLPLLINGKHHLLITSRCDYSRLYPTLKIDPIESLDSLKELFMKNYQGDDVDEDDPALTELIELVDRHTYTIELLAQHMENSGQTPAEMIDELKNHGIISMDEKVRNPDMKTQRAYENLLKMFNVFSLDGEERRILMHLTMMPIDGVDIRGFKKWVAMKSSRVLRKLENHGWITKNTDGIALHPIIREVVKHEIPVETKEIQEFLSNFCETIHENTAWNYSKAEKERYAKIALSIKASLGAITEATFEFVYFLRCLLSYSVNPELSLTISDELYEFCLRHYGADHLYTARVAYAIGWTYQFNTFLPNALEQSRVWMEKAAEIIDRGPIETVEHKKVYSSLLRDLADTYYMMAKASPEPERLEKATQAHKKAVDYVTGILQEDPHFPGVLAGIYIGVSGIASLEKNFQEALLYSDKAYRIFADSVGEDHVDTSHATAKKALALYAMNEYQAAYECGSRVLPIFTAAYGEQNMWVCDMTELMGDCKSMLKENGVAAEHYRNALLQVEKLYAPGSQRILTLQTKISQVTPGTP